MTAGTTTTVLSATTSLPGETPAQIIGAADGAGLRAAAHASGAHAFVSELPEGFHTPVGAGGVPVTASQRVRLLMARLLAQEPSAVVLDGPTKGLDAAGEAAVLPGLEVLARHHDVTVLNASPAVRAVVDGAPSPSRQSLVPADPALPTLPALLDPHAMNAVLGSMLGGGTADVRIQSVRYKPEDNVVVQYAVGSDTGWHTAVAYAHATSPLRHKHKRPVNRKLAKKAGDRAPARKAFVYLPDLEALVQWMPLDVRLPILADRPERLRERLAKKGVLPGDGPTEPELLRYWPRRRAVLRFGSHVLKAYREPGDFEAAWRALRTASGLGRVQTPAGEAVLKRKQVTVQGWVPGRNPSLWPSSSERAGAVLADLHGEGVVHGPRTRPSDVLAKATGRAELVARLLPDLRFEVDGLLADLGALAPHQLPTVTSHGNYHAGQLLAGPSGLVLVDLDRLCRAAPAYDLASYAAHVAFGRDGDAEAVHGALESLVVGYGSRPRGLDWYVAACLLRRAVVPFRFQDEHWPEATAALVHLASRLLR
jgi:Phosphotransferase enzyme family